MNRQPVVLFRGSIMAVLILSMCAGAAPAQEASGVQKTSSKQPTAALSAALDRMITEGKSQRELAQYVFDTHGCNGCHTMGREGRLGFTSKGNERAKGFEGCISTLKAMSLIAKVPEDQRSATQRRRAQLFEEFGCATCHKLTPGKMGLTEVGAKLAHLHLGCVDVEKIIASSPASQH